MHAFEERRRPVQIWRWAPFRGRQRAAVDPCKIDVRSSTLRCSTISFPSSHLGEGAPLLTEEGTFESCGGSQSTTSDAGPDVGRRTGIDLHYGRKTCCHRLAARTPASLAVDAGSSPAGSTIRPRNRLCLRSTSTVTGACRFDSCRGRQYQRVGESGRPYLPWKQGIGGSNPPTLTNHRALAEWSGDGL